jgi:hypothetical protein
MIINTIIVVVVLTGVYFLAKSINGRADATIVGKAAPAFLYTTADGEERLLAPHKFNAISFFVFMAECPHCIDAVPAWNMVAGGTERVGEILGVSLSPREQTSKFIKEQGVNFPVALIGSEFMENYKISATPTTITVEQGVVKHVSTGVPDGTTMSYLYNTHRKDRY